MGQSLSSSSTTVSNLPHKASTHSSISLERKSKRSFLNRELCEMVNTIYYDRNTTKSF